MRLLDIMDTSVETVSAGDSAEVAWEKMREGKIHHLVVMEGKNMVGVISERDLGGKNGSEIRKNHRVADLASLQVVTASPDTTFRKAANLMRGNTIGCLPILDKGKVVGIITISDLLELIGKGAEKAIVKSKRWTLKHRGMRPNTLVGRY